MRTPREVNRALLRLRSVTPTQYFTVAFLFLLLVFVVVLLVQPTAVGRGGR